MHICFRQQWCPRSSTEVSTSNLQGWEKTQQRAVRREKRQRALSACSSQALPAFYLALQTSAFREHWLSSQKIWSMCSWIKVEKISSSQLWSSPRSRSSSPQPGRTFLPLRTAWCSAKCVVPPASRHPNASDEENHHNLKKMEPTSPFHDASSRSCGCPWTLQTCQRLPEIFFVIVIIHVTWNLPS